jgi:hypothetical protein
LKGNYTGGKVAYGYKLENQKLVIDEDEAQVVRDVFTFYAGGMKLVDIVKNLNDRNIKYRNSPFTTHCLYSMLRKETYTGIYTVDGKTYDNIYPQIITKELFDTVHKRTSANKYGKHTDVTYLLKGLLFCGYCGDKLASYTGTSRSGKLSRYYRCVTANKGKELCECKLMRKERIEELVVETLKNLITNNEDVELIAKAVVKVHNEKIKVNTNLDNFERELAATKKSIANIMTAIEAGIFTETTRERLQELEILKRDLENKIFDEKSKTVVEYTEQQVIDYIKSGKTKNDEQLINLLVGRVSLYNDRVVITIKGSATDTTPNDDDRKSYIKYYGEGKSQINNSESPERKVHSDQGFSIDSNYVFKNNQKQINRGPKTKYKSYSVSIGI